MFEKLIQLDKELLIYLNSLGSEQWDPFWLFITNQFNWAPLFAFIIFLIFKEFSWKKGLFLVIFIFAMAAFSDQFTNIIRGIFERLRPNNDEAINAVLRTLITPQSFSFTSGHATTSMAFAVFVYLLLREQFSFVKWVFVFPIFFAYSRLYLGVHFPIDILTGALIGSGIGCGFYKLQASIVPKLFN